MQKFLRRTHGALGLLFGAFILIQGVTAVLLGFDDQIEKFYGESTVKTIENIHKGKIYGSFKSPIQSTGWLIACLHVNLWNLDWLFDNQR